MLDLDKILNIIAIVGVIAFAISGALTAMDRKFDVLGVVIIGFTTAVGGGSLRDIIIPERDVFWIVEPIYTYMAILGSVLAVIFHNKIQHLRTTLSLFDTIGLGLYTIIGVQIGIQYDLPGISCVILGAITGTFGGVIRDILVNEVPLVFQKEIYISISLLGGSIYYLIYWYESHGAWVEILGISIIIILRLIVVKFEISFPTLYKNEKE
ncbi:MAG: hypothetical protein B6I18_01850 [Bacteroidetes bacterium 4572_112]|nr:MAG: hypothetical protein B6I18_01850 [Bacteroidetes bacterium 4572_112]